MAIFEPLDEEYASDDSKRTELDRYHSALALYRQQAWTQAAEIFRKLSAGLPEEDLYQLYLSRIDNFQHHPPPPDWDGVTVFTQK